MSRPRPVFLKLGGALLTDKAGNEALHEKVLARLATEIASSGVEPGRLVVAHGSGSFAHRAVSATDFLNRPGRPMPLAVVADAAARLNRHVVRAMLAEGLPAVGVPGLMLARCHDGEINTIRAGRIGELLDAGLVPVTYGDAVLDETRGSAVASTEPLLAALASKLRPTRIVLATDVDGVFDADPTSRPEARPIRRVNRSMLAGLSLGSARAGATDVTGGMASKVRHMLAAVEAEPSLEVRVISGLRVGAVRAALAGEAGAGGTKIVAG